MTGPTIDDVLADTMTQRLARETARYVDDLAARAMHRATLDTVLTLAEAGLLDDTPAAALYTIGIRPPARYLTEQRNRYPHVYAMAEDLTPAQEEPLTRAALDAYVDDLTDLTVLIHRLREDPVGELDALGYIDALAPHAHLAGVAEDVAQEKQDEYDALLGESLAPSVDAHR